MKKVIVIPTNWCDPLLTGPKRVIGDPPFGCPDIERLLMAIQGRHDAAMKDAAKAERRRVRALVLAYRQKWFDMRAVNMLNGRNKLAAIQEQRVIACDDILAALKEGR